MIKTIIYLIKCNNITIFKSNNKELRDKEFIELSKFVSSIVKDESFIENGIEFEKVTLFNKVRSKFL